MTVPATMQAAASAVAVARGVGLPALRGRSRLRAVVRARCEAVYEVRLQTGRSWAVIGAFFGGRDGGTARHCYQAYRDNREAWELIAPCMASIATRVLARRDLIIEDIQVRSNPRFIAEARAAVVRALHLAGFSHVEIGPLVHRHPNVVGRIINATATCAQADKSWGCAVDNACTPSVG